MGKSAGYVSPEYLRRSAELTGKLKKASYDLMNVFSGAKVLDLGCGPGLDTVALAKLVGDSGKVFGLDMDEEMIRLAEEATEKEGLSTRTFYQVGNVDKLPYEDNFFDACRAERLFQVLPSKYPKEKIFDEIWRVTKSGGRMVLADTDWATASVDYPDAELERRLLGFFARSMRPNGFAGRQFFKLFMDKEMRDIQIETFPLVVNDLSMTPFGNWLANESIQAEIATEKEIKEWLGILTKDQDTGRFYASVNMVLGSGIKM